MPDVRLLGMAKYIYFSVPIGIVWFEIISDDKVDAGKDFQYGF